MALNFEEILFPLTLDFDLPDTTWWVAHTKPNQEKKLSRQLIQEEVHHFFPLIERRKKDTNGRFRLSIRPLFPGYLFFTGEHESRRLALTTGRIANIISVLDQDQFRHELKQIYLALQSGLTIDPCKNIKQGKIYSVVSGPGMGLKGKVITLKRKNRIVIEIESIGQSIMVEVDAEDLAPQSDYNKG